MADPVRLSFTHQYGDYAHLVVNDTHSFPSHVLQAACLCLTHGRGKVAAIQLLRAFAPNMGLYTAKVTADFLQDLVAQHPTHYVLEGSHEAFWKAHSAVNPKAPAQPTPEAA